jgi:ketosteroid isomerase-like protein
LSLKKEFQNQTDAWINAYNSKDANNLTALYTEDAVYISGHVAGLELDGRNKVLDL